MQYIFKISLLASFMFIFAACNQKTELAKKKAKMEELKKEQQKLNDKITGLQEDIDKLDPSSVSSNAKLVVLVPVGPTAFNHYIDLQGKIEAMNIANVAPRGQGGFVKQVLVKQGDNVQKGQTLLKLDGAVLSQNVAAAQQQVGGVKAQLEQAKSIYQRQQNLWKQNIGTEIQVLNAKTNMDALQSQYNAALANIRIAQEQLNTTNIISEISGTANIVNVKVGEFFNGAQQIQIVNNNDLKIKVNVPEAYADKIKAGNILKVTLPEAGNMVLNSKVTVAGKVIDPITRSFYVEGSIPADKKLRANQLANVQIEDYALPNAITIPVNTLQTDDKGKFVLVAVKDTKGEWIAHKKPIVIGELYGDQLEVKSGLAVGDQIITEGFQSLYDGQRVTTIQK
jgi:membrane fusion protein (multidrug efflux system)